MHLKVGLVKHDSTAIETVDGKPKFMGQRLLPSGEVLAGLAFWYPIIPEFIDPDTTTTNTRYYGFVDLDMSWTPSAPARLRCLPDKPPKHTPSALT